MFPPTPPWRRVLAVSGWQGSGKTTLLVTAVLELRRLGLSVAVVKHDAHGVRLDVAGKDSDRLFRAGADVALDGPDERFERSHPAEREPLDQLLLRLERRHDLVLVEGYKTVPLPRVWLLAEGEVAPPPEVPGITASLPPHDRDSHFLALVRERLRVAWAATPLRVGVPGALPAAPGVDEPLGSLLAALRWDPDATWVTLPDCPPAARDAWIRWLLAQRRPGCWAVRIGVAGRLRPLPALYEPQSAALLESLAAAGHCTADGLAEHPRTVVAEPPPELWRSEADLAGRAGDSSGLVGA